jgi:hypothetical protein
MPDRFSGTKSPNKGQFNIRSRGIGTTLGLTATAGILTTGYKFNKKNRRNPITSSNKKNTANKPDKTLNTTGLSLNILNSAYTITLYPIYFEY